MNYLKHQLIAFIKGEVSIDVVAMTTTNEQINCIKLVLQKPWLNACHIV